VQAEGTIGGQPFYFRARDDRWTIAIGGDVIDNTRRGAADEPSWFYEEEYPNAGWMAEVEARASATFSTNSSVGASSETSPQGHPEPPQDSCPAV
jgi:hypothetical protein